MFILSSSSLSVIILYISSFDLFFDVPICSFIPFGTGGVDLFEWSLKFKDFLEGGPS